MNETESRADPTSFDRPCSRLTRAQTTAAIARVFARYGSDNVCAGFSYWTKDNSAPVYATRKEAEQASIEEWRNNL